MPRSNRPRRRHGARPGDRDEAEDSLERLRAGWRRTETRRDGEWTVQPISATSAVKAYVCPGCTVPISPGTAHVVAWRNDSILGAKHALADRRHWHSHCWRMKP